MEVISHRGLGFSYPENSNSAIYAALSSGFPVETDVRITKDGIPVISHDPDFKRLFGNDAAIGKSTFHDTKKLSYAGTGEGVNTFYDVCYLIKHFGKMYNAIHVKEVEKGKIEKIISMIRSFQIEDNVFLFAVDEETLKLAKISKRLYKGIKVALHLPQQSPLFRKRFIKMCDILWVDELDAGWYSQEMAAIANEMGKKIIAMSPELLRPASLEEIKKRCLEIKGMGFDGICTDYPKELGSHMKKGKK